MSTAAEFAQHTPHGEDARADENFVRVLFVEDRTDLADEIRSVLSRDRRGSFEIVCERDLVKAAARIERDTYDLLLLDLSLCDVERQAAIELATDLAHRLPVVVLAGTEDLVDPERKPDKELASCMEQADIPGKLRQAIRRSRRFGTGTLTPVFCRIEGLQG